MATNVSIYVPNQGELEMLKAILGQKAMTLFLYRNQVIPDGSTIFNTLSEMPSGGGRGYARKELTRDILETLATADKWYVATNGEGKAEGAYNDAVLSWAFNDYDVADGYTVYGVGAFCWVLPFDASDTEIKVGDKIKGATSGATGIVTGVCVQSGTWAGGDAAGYLDIMTVSGTFQDGENIIYNGAIATGAVNAGGTGYAVGDIVTVTQSGAVGAKIVITGVDGYGAVTSFVVVDGGQGYSVDTGLATVALTGSGNDDFTIDISTLSTTALAVTNTGTDFSGDAHKKLLAVWAYASGIEIITDGQAITWDHKMALSTGT